MFNTISHNLFNTSTYAQFAPVFSILHTFCVEGLGSKKVQQILQEEEFDLVMLSIINSECFLPYIYQRQVPWLYISPNTVQGAYSHLAANPFFSSLVGSHILHLDLPLSFTGRM
ncbi:hypothetical protein Pcinc_022866, partial [Petrolisthes cinctipes]